MKRGCVIVKLFVALAVATSASSHVGNIHNRFQALSNLRLGFAQEGIVALRRGWFRPGGEAACGDLRSDSMSARVVATAIALAAAIFIGGCGGSAESIKTLDYETVAVCLDDAAIGFNGRPEPGMGDPNKDFPPFSFSDAPGGWIVADLGQAQRVYILFYSTELEAGRLREGTEIVFEGAGQRGNILYGFGSPPIDEERERIEDCL